MKRSLKSKRAGGLDPTRLGSLDLHSPLVELSFLLPNYVGAEVNPSLLLDPRNEGVVRFTRLMI